MGMCNGGAKAFNSVGAYINFFFFVRWLRSSSVAVLGQEFVHQSLMELKSKPVLAQLPNMPKHPMFLWHMHGTVKKITT